MQRCGWVAGASDVEIACHDTERVFPRGNQPENQASFLISGKKLDTHNNPLIC